MTDPNHDPRTPPRSDTNTNVNVTPERGGSTGPIAMVVVALIVIVALLWVFGVFGGDAPVADTGAAGDTNVTVESPEASATAGSDAEAEAPAADAEATDAPAAEADADAEATTEETAPATE